MFWFSIVRRSDNRPNDSDEQHLTADIITLAKDYGRYGYRRIHALLARAGWQVSLLVVEHIWRREGLKVPKRQPGRRRLWLGDGSCIRLRPQHHGHVWSCDFVEDQTHYGRKFRMLNIIDEFSRKTQFSAANAWRWCRCDGSARTTCSSACSSSMGRPAYQVRHDPEFVVHAMREWLGRLGVTILYIEPRSPWENSYSLEEVRVVTGWSRDHYNRAHPHSSLG